MITGSPLGMIHCRNGARDVQRSRGAHRRSGEREPHCGMERHGVCNRKVTRTTTTTTVNDQHNDDDDDHDTTTHHRRLLRGPELPLGVLAAGRPELPLGAPDADHDVTTTPTPFWAQDLRKVRSLASHLCRLPRLLRSGAAQSSRLPAPLRVVASSARHGCPPARLRGRCPVTSAPCFLSGGRSTPNWRQPFERSFTGICLSASTRYLTWPC
jgi:hypothetical protein